MEKVASPKNSLSASQKNMNDYFDTHDVKYVHEDAVFVNMATGETHNGKSEISAMLHYIYKVAFDAKADVYNRVITEDKAYLEAFFTGKHIAEFAGIQATGKEVRVPISVSYELEEGLIKKARIYFLVGVLIDQLN